MRLRFPHGSSIVLGLATALSGCGGAGQERAARAATPKPNSEDAAIAHRSGAVVSATPVSLYPDELPSRPRSLLANGPASADYRALRFVGMDDGPVPGFDVRALDGREVSSNALIGQRPFVVVFFATWCPSCRDDLDGLGQTLEQLGQLEVIAVSLDERETLARVPSFLAQRGLAVPCVAGLRYPGFTLAYNPFETVPAVIVVAKSGGLVDYMLGESVETQRLVRSVNLARRIGRLRAPAPAH